MRLLLIIAALSLAGLAGLAGCASKSAPGSAAPGAPSASDSGALIAAPPRPSLAAEQKRLGEVFKGTPVVFSMQDDGSLKVEVPLIFCFDRGAFVVKPPLAAVLDRLALSQRGNTTKLRVSAAGDTAGSGSNLARDRAASTRDYLGARGVAAARVVLASGAAGAGVGVEIVVHDAAPEKR